MTTDGRLFLTADTHLGHANLLTRHHLRPQFASIEEHDAYLIQQINDTVGPTGTLLHLGDFAWGGFKKIAHYRSQLHVGRLILICGNHDRGKRSGQYNIRRLAEHFDEVYASMLLPLESGEYATLTHQPNRHYLPNLHGHSHSPGPVPHPGCVDVGVDAWQSRPVALQEALEVLYRYWPPHRKARMACPCETT